jgi:hypothetical protein
MPTRRFDPNKEQSVADAPAGNTGTGNDTHAPIGKGSFDTSFKFRLLSRFAHDWSGMTKVTKVELKFKLTSEIHTEQGSSRRVNLTRLGSTFSSGGGGENSWSTSAAEVWPGPTGTGSTEDYSLTSWSNGDWVTLDITPLYDNYIPSTVLGPDGLPGAGDPNNGIRIWSYDETTTSRSFEFYGKDSSYPYYILVTYSTNSTPGKPVLTSPVGGTTLAPGTTPLLSWTGSDPDFGDSIDLFDLHIDDNPDFAFREHTGTHDPVGYSLGFNVTNWPYIYGGLPAGVPLYWRVRALDQAGAVSPWSDAGQFMLGVVPTIASMLPNAGLADIWNLDDLNVWTSGGNWAKTIHQFVYNHAAGKSMNAYRLRIYDSAGTTTLLDTGTVAATALAGATVKLNSSYAVILGTAYKWTVEVRDSDGNWSAAMTKQDFKVRWGQAIYAQNVGAGAGGLKLLTGTLANPGRMATIFQSSTNADGTGTPTAWSATLGGLTSVLAHVRVLVRLSATVSGSNPSVPDITLQYLAASQVPDNWTITGGTGPSIKLDGSIKRFGEFSAKVGGTGTMALYPFRKTTGDGVDVQEGTVYNFSAFVKAAAALSGSVSLAIRDLTGAAIPDVTLVGTVLTQNTLAALDGWQRLAGYFTVPTGVTAIQPTIVLTSIGSGDQIWVDGVKLEEGRVATGWSPGFLGGAIVLDAQGFIADATYGGSVRLRGSGGAARDVVELGAHGLKFAGDTELSSPSTGVLAVNGTPIGSGGGGSVVAVSLYKSTSQSIPDNVATAILWNVEEYDLGGLHDNVSNTSRITAAQAGQYHFDATVRWEGNATGLRSFYFRVTRFAGGTEEMGRDRQSPLGTSDFWEGSVSTDIDMAVGDYVEVMALQNSGIALNLQGTSAHNVRFSAHLIGGATGATGAGVPAGGASGALLRKNSATDYDTVWQGTITRKIWLPYEMGRLDGTTGSTMGGSPDGVSFAALADGAQIDGLFWSFIVPWDYASGSFQVRPVWAPAAADAVAHAVRWQVTMGLMNAGLVADAASTNTAFDGISAARATAKVVVVETGIAHSLVVAAHDLVKLSVRRDANHANDTFVGQVNLMGCILEYTAKY